MSFLILWLVLAICFAGLVVGFLLTMGAGNILADKLKVPNNDVSGNKLKRLAVITTNESASNEPKYFIKLAGNKIPIDASEVKDAQKKGYEILRE